MKPEIIQQAAQQIAGARLKRQKIRPLTAQHPGLSIDDAYAVQRAWLDSRIAAGCKLRGMKIGLTSKAMQVEAKLDEPDYGVILDDEIYPDSGIIPSDRFIAPRVEVELAFVMRTDLRGPDCTLFDVLRATEYVVPAIELLDSRIERVDSVTQARRTVVDNICDNAANAGLITGGRPMRPLDDLRWVSALCYLNGAVVESGVAAAVMNHPGNAVAWLVNKLSEHDVSLRAGDTVLSGSFIRIIDVQPGDTFHADFGTHGSVSCHFSKEAAA